MTKPNIEKEKDSFDDLIDSELGTLVIEDLFKEAIEEVTEEAKTKKTKPL